MASGTVQHNLEELLSKFNEESTSCTPTTPFITLGGGTPPSINYNIPQKTGFTVSSLVSITKEGGDFHPEFSEIPPDNLWDELDTAMGEAGPAKIGKIKNIVGKTTEGKEQIKTDAKFGYFDVPEPEAGLPAAKVNIDTQAKTVPNITLDPSLPYTYNDDNPNATNGNTTVLTHINGINYSDGVITNNYNQGYYPVPVKNLYGDLVLDFIKRPEPEPEIFLAIQFKVESFLGNYGAGKVVKTMSLMPGEKTTISLKTFRNITETKKHSDNVLDSFSQNSADSLEKIFESESSQSKVKSGGLSLGINIKGVNLGGSASKGTSSASKTINKALTKHVEESQAQRKVEVNNETSSTITEGEETSIVRELKNINLSRVLNFTFRQMNQEYIVITYIDDISLVYSNGYPETEEIARLQDMDEFLNKYIQDSGKLEELKNQIIMSVYNLRDYLGERQDCFIEKQDESEVPESLSGTISPETYTYWGKDETFSQSYTTFSVPGIITQVERHILSTDSVVAEALLGQAEALDCYNIQLQNQGVLKTKTESLEKLQQLTKIEAMSWESSDKDIEMYKAVYDKCCDDKIIDALNGNTNPEK